MGHGAGWRDRRRRRQEEKEWEKEQEREREAERRRWKEQTFDDKDMEAGGGQTLTSVKVVDGIVPEPGADTQLAVQQDVVISKSQKCRNCCFKFVAFLFSTIGLSCLLVAYTVMGGLIFIALERPYEQELKANIAEMRRLHIEMLWNMTKKLNVLHEENWTIGANDILTNYTQNVYVATKFLGWDGSGSENIIKPTPTAGTADEDDPDLQWTFPGSMLYCITVITTIGYGHIAPKTTWGRVVTIAYAIVGIPLTLLTLTNLGGFMATAFRFLYKNICCGLCCICCPTRDTGQVTSSTVKYKDAENGDPAASRSLTDKNSPPHSPQKFPVRVTWRKGIARMMKTEDNKRVTVPIYISLLLISGYIAIGALLFTLWEEDWDYLVGSYFCFITLTTIGFGDYVPGMGREKWAQDKLILCCLYLVFGLALIAMSFDLMQEEVRSKCRFIATKLGLVTKKS